MKARLILLAVGLIGVAMFVPSPFTNVGYGVVVCAIGASAF